MDHFHGTAFAGLIGGSVEVFARSHAWADGDAPRPLPFMVPPPNGIPAPALTVVVPVVATTLSRTVQEDPEGEWAQYLRTAVRASQERPNVAVYPVVASTGAYTPGSVLHGILGHMQSLGGDGSDLHALAADLGHSISNFVDERPGGRLKVFVSHTKHPGPTESRDAIGELNRLVREVLGETHMMEFFDASDLQPGSDWKTELISSAESSALLMVRTDRYSSRDWCQREVLAAKRADMPIVQVMALTTGEERGSFLMDHVPTVTLRQGDSPELQRRAIAVALNKIVDEALKRSLWRQQTSRLMSYGFDWLPANAPEPLSLAHWLGQSQLELTQDDRAFVLHPDPPLGQAEMDVLEDILITSGRGGLVEILTPRRFATRGGQVNP